MVLLMASAAGLPVQAAWRDYRSNHFQLYSDADPAQARALIRDLERFRSTLGLLTGFQVDRQVAPRFLIFGFASTADLQQLTGRGNVDGLYFGALDQPVALLSLDGIGRSGRSAGVEVVFHEYVHFLLDRHDDFAYPLWYEEGYADYLSTMRFDGEDAIIGAVSAPRKAQLELADGDWIGLPVLLNSGPSYLSDATRRETPVSALSLQYAQGWLLVHWLNSSKARQAGLSTFLKTINDPDRPPGPAFEAAFGLRLDAAQAALKAYWRRGDLPLKRVRLDRRYRDLRLQERTLAPIEAACIPAEALARLEAWDKVTADRREALANAFAQAPRQADLGRTLVRSLRYAAGNWQDALLLNTELLARFPRDAGLLTEQADLLLAQEKAPVRPEAESLLRRAVEADPAYLPAYVMLVRLYLDGQGWPQDAEQALAAARALAPGHDLVDLLAAQAYLKTDRIAEARSELARLAAFAGTPSRRKLAREILDALSALDQDGRLGQ